MELLVIVSIIRAMLNSPTPAVREAGEEVVKTLLREHLLEYSEEPWDGSMKLWFNTFDGRKWLEFKRPDYTGYPRLVEEGE